MGYRHYFYLVNDDVIEKASKLTVEDIKKIAYNEEDSEYLPIDTVLDDPETVFEFGKLYFCNTYDLVSAKAKRLFPNKCADDYYDDYDAQVIKADGVDAAIEAYRTKIVEYLKEEFEKSEEELGKEAKQTIRKKLFDWDQYYREPGEYILTQSWLYEYSIFNLMHIRHKIDWDYQSLVFIGR